MTTMVAAAVIIGILTFVLTRNLERSNGQSLQEPRSEKLSMGVQIVCGDCGGDGESAARTYLSRSGRCETCGGTSYVLASSLAMSAALARASHSGRRVLAFETQLQRVSRRTTKLAV